MEQHKNNNFSSLLAIVSVFFFWGFLAASNGIFIPFCKTYFKLSQFQSQLVDSAFYGAYFIGSLILYVISLWINKDIVNTIGYKKTIIFGLLISVLGAIIMIPAVNIGSFDFILFALFIIALGFSLQQTSANPMILNIGDPATGSHRLNFAGSVNSLGTTIGPILISLALFDKFIAGDEDKKTVSIDSINTLYIILGIAFGISIFILYRAKIKRLDIEEKSDEKMKILKSPFYFIQGILILFIGIFLYFAYKNKNSSNSIFLIILAIVLIAISFILQIIFKKYKTQHKIESKSYPQIIWGMLAIFVYVGVEVTIQSNLGSLLKLDQFGGFKDSEIGPFISVYWGSLMIGRWTGAIGAFKIGKQLKLILTIVVPFLALMLVLFMNHVSNNNIEYFYKYAFLVAVLILAFIWTNQKPVLSLITFSLLGAIAMILGMCTEGIYSVYFFLSGGLFCSIMWPCIFSLAIAGLGKYTSQASGFLIMMILGGAFIPPLQGLIADKTNIHLSYIITVFCFLFLLIYAVKVKGILSKNGINYDQSESFSH